MRYYLSVILYVAATCTSPFALEAEDEVLKYVIDGIRTYDELVTSIEVNFHIQLPADGGREFAPSQRWAREGRKEYIESERIYRDEKRPSGFSRLIEEFRFDGERMYTLNTTPPVGDFKERIGGSIREKKVAEFESNLNPRHFLGGHLCTRYSNLSDLLTKGSRRVSVKEQNGGIVVLEVDYDAEPDNPEYPDFDFPRTSKIWIDTEKQFRPVRIETYADREKPFGGVELALMNELSDIELCEYDGFFLPCRGTYTAWHHETVPNEGYTPEDILAMPKEEALKHVTTKREAMGIGPLVMIVTETAVNKGIDPSEFRVTFPPGTRVFDAFANYGYIVEDLADVGVPAEPDLETSVNASEAAAERVTDLPDEGASIDPKIGKSWSADTSPAIGTMDSTAKRRDTKTVVLVIVAAVSAVVVSMITVRKAKRAGNAVK